MRPDVWTALSPGDARGSWEGRGDELGSSPVDPTDRSRSLCPSHTKTSEKQTGHSRRRAASGELVSTCSSRVYPMFSPVTGCRTGC